MVNYRYCGFHARTLATAIAVVSLVAGVVTLYEDRDKVRDPEALQSTSIGRIISIAMVFGPPICVLLADKMEAPSLYLPQIITCVLNLIGLSVLLILWCMANVSADCVESGWMLFDARVGEYSAALFFMFSGILVVGIALFFVILKITVKARRYMIDEIKTGVILGLLKPAKIGGIDDIEKF